MATGIVDFSSGNKQVINLADDTAKNTEKLPLLTREIKRNDLLILTEC